MQNPNNQAGPPTHLLLPIQLLESLGAYLTKQPWDEVNSLLSGLSRLESVARKTYQATIPESGREPVKLEEVAGNGGRLRGGEKAQTDG